MKALSACQSLVEKSPKVDYIQRIIVTNKRLTIIGSSYVLSVPRLSPENLLPLDDNDVVAYKWFPIHKPPRILKTTHPYFKDLAYQFIKRVFEQLNVNWDNIDTTMNDLIAYYPI